MLRRDKYNKQLWKYYVEYEEGNESMDEEIEREIEEEQVVLDLFPATPN